jgi:hypothetical protein
VWTLIESGPGSAACEGVEHAHDRLISARGLEALLHPGNPLGPAGAPLPSAGLAPVIAVRSGRIEPDSEDETDRMDAARRTWSGEGRARFEDAWRSLRDGARGGSLWLHPIAGDVFGDVPGLRGLPSLGMEGIVFEPARLLTGRMIADAEDHLARLVEAAEGTGLVRVTLVTDRDADGRRARIGEGVLGGAVLHAVLRRVEGIAPIGLLEGDLALIA